MRDPSEISLGRDARERFEALLGAIRDAQNHWEFMLYLERFFAIQTEIRHYFTLVEREIVDKLREFRETEEREAAADPRSDRVHVFVRPEVAPDPEAQDRSG